MSLGDAELLVVLHSAVDAIAHALAELDEWGPLATDPGTEHGAPGQHGTHPGQHGCDVVADKAALAVLEQAGLGVWSEESGHHWPERAVVVVLDPVDGSANAARGLAFYAASLCALDAHGPRAAVVAHLAGGARYQAIRGGGSWRDGSPICPSGCISLAQAVVGLNGWPPRHLGWGHYRAFGSAALELCMVADSSLDGYLDVSRAGLAPWDYLGALLVCTEAGAVVKALDEAPLWQSEHRRPLLAAATPELCGQLLDARRQIA